MTSKKDIAEADVVFSIIGLYGAKDGYLVEPGDPSCKLVVVLADLKNRGIATERFIYVIDDDQFRSIGDDSKVLDILADRDFCKEEIDKYLLSDRIEIRCRVNAGRFSKYISPLIRHNYPKMMNNLVSVQPMTTPSGLKQYIINRCDINNGNQENSEEDKNEDY